MISLKQSLKNLFFRWAAETSVHGLSKIFVEESGLRVCTLIWTGAFILSAVVCFYISIDLLVEYLRNEVTTLVQIIPEIPAIFPQVTICNFNVFVTEYAAEFLNSIDAELSNYTGPYASDLKYNVPFMRAKNLPDESRRKLGYTIEESLIKCMMFGQKCEPEDFESSYHPFYGNCFIFNSGKQLRKITQKGQLASFSFQLFVGSLGASNTSEIGSGGVVFISNHLQSPFEFPEYLLNPTLMTRVGIERTCSQRLNAPYSMCKENGVNSQYDAFTCIQLCNIKYIVDKCQCLNPLSLLTSHSFLNVSACSSLKEALCIISQAKSMTEMCQGECPYNCETKKYNAHISASTFPDEAYARNSLLNNTKVIFLHSEAKVNLTYENLISQIVAAEIFYNEMEYTRIDEMPYMTGVAMFGKLGGIFGLFLGMSIISFVDLVELVFWTMMFLSRRCARLMVYLE